ncbi:ATP-binding protein [Streptomyces pini]|uniref:ATP-binding protein n=1 Tax=Streptomyces pini TaxID=1520580 RepID=UPI000B84BC1F|nr:ATP-binding protein [Streptomyces pini]
MTIAARPHAIGAPGYSETWPCEPESAGRARSLVRAAISAWGLEQLIDDGTLITSELVGNAVQHSDCRLLRVSVTLVKPGRVRIAVADKSTSPTKLLKPRDDDTGGRGLLLVNELADGWGTDHRRWGKVVWAEVCAGGDAS